MEEPVSAAIKQAAMLLAPAARYGDFSMRAGDHMKMKAACGQSGGEEKSRKGLQS